MILEIGHGWKLAFEARKHTVHIIAERLASDINVIIAAMQEIHWHIKDVVDPLFISKVIIEHTGGNTAARCICIGPSMSACRHHSRGDTILEWRIGKQRRCHWLECQ